MDFRDVMKHKGVDIFKVAGPFLMGTLHIYEEVIRVVEEKPKIRIVNLEKVPFFVPPDFTRNAGSAFQHDQENGFV